MPKQKTIRSECSLEGISLHHNKAVRLTFLPAGADSGLFFLFRKSRIRVCPGSLFFSASKYTTLTDGIESIICVEHVLAALAGLGLTNVGIKLEGDSEPPWMDGSALPFVKLLLSAGVVGQNAGLRTLSIDQLIFLSDKDSGAFVKIFPSDRLKIDCQINFSNILGRQRYIHRFSPFSFLADIAAARSFLPHAVAGREEEAKRRLPGLVLNGADSNLIVYNDNGYITPTRFENEPVRHKILDFLGDLTVLGHPISAYVSLNKPSHKLNNLLVKRICEIYPDNFTPLPRPITDFVPGRRSIYKIHYPRHLEAGYSLRSGRK